MSSRVKKEILKLEKELLRVDFMQLKGAKNDREYAELKAKCDIKIKILEELNCDDIMELVSFYNGIILANLTKRYTKGGYINTILPEWVARKVARFYKAKEIFYYTFADNNGVLWNIILDFLPQNGEGEIEYMGLITALQNDRTVHYKMANEEEFFQHDEMKFERVS